MQCVLFPTPRPFYLSYPIAASQKVLAPSIESLKKAVQTYARQGGTSTIFVNDDGLWLLPAPDHDERLSIRERLKRRHGRRTLHAPVLRACASHCRRGDAACRVQDMREPSARTP
ncbi:hypothetical protein FB451DRAFT_1034377 [Mycena latifolia]|nr:hypothetical protein FB451DRAFT_1034377 [Mycena latifolia]